METVLVLEILAELDKVVEAVVLFEMGGDLLEVKDLSTLLVFIGVPVIKGVIVR